MDEMRWEEWMMRWDEWMMRWFVFSACGGGWSVCELHCFFILWMVSCVLGRGIISLTHIMEKSRATTDAPFTCQLTYGGLPAGMIEGVIQLTWDVKESSSWSEWMWMWFWFGIVVGSCAVYHCYDNMLFFFYSMVQYNCVDSLCFMLVVCFGGVWLVS